MRRPGERRVSISYWLRPTSRRPSWPQVPDQSALISFTSGSTGRPKGADRTHSILLAQHDALQAHAPGREGEIDMPCFPAVVLHNLSCGISSVVPPIDLRHPDRPIRRA